MKYVLVIIGKRPQEKEVVARFKEEHPLGIGDSFQKILIGPSRLEQDSRADDPRARLAEGCEDPTEWLVWVHEDWRLEGEGEYTSLETYILRRMKGGEVNVYYVNLDSYTARRDAVNRELSSLGWIPLAFETPVGA